ncbi:MAG: hypothetical protein PHD81_01065 [Candidatus Nanoarchaeia archaeon]|nr:hypothetical protein [Candidatus Nanoarchaeia archaeon]MDD5587681.1 hypothetical protein [Candidatus Nanoarchaeia archaeon]
MKKKKEVDVRDYIILILIVSVCAFFILSFINFTTGNVLLKRSCNDTDGGYNQFVKGTVTAVSKGRYAFEAKTDYCAYVQVGPNEENKYSAVKEYFCGSDPESSNSQDFTYSEYNDKLVICEKGCKDGACIK